jgi:RNA polymerase sigma-70 factor (ECF subfamily)
LCCGFGALRAGVSIIDDIPRTDRDLIQAASKGDAEAWRMLYTRWLPWTWRCAYSLMENVHEAEEVMSEAMLAWVQHIGETSQDSAQLAVWLRTVVYHKAVDYMRQRDRSRRAMQIAASLQQEGRRSCELPALPESADRPETGEILARLSESQRLLLEWKYLDGLSVRQIAERLGASEKAIQARLYRAREDIRRENNCQKLAAEGALSGPQRQPRRHNRDRSI